MKINQWGRLFLIEAPSGAGKDKTLEYFKKLGCVEIKTGTMRAPRSNSADDGALVFLNPDISVGELKNRGFDYASTQYGNQYYVSMSEISNHIKNGQDCVMIMSKQATIDGLKNNPLIRNNMTHIFIYRNGLTLDFLNELNFQRKNRALTAKEELETEHRYERAKYLFTRVNEGKDFDSLILNVGNLNFLKEQVEKIYISSKIEKKDKDGPRIFCIMGTDKEDVDSMIYLTSHRLLCNGIEVIDNDNRTIANIKNHLKQSKDIILPVNNFHEINRIKEVFPKIDVKTGFLFSDNTSNYDYARNRLIEYSRNISDIDFTALVSLPFMHRDDIFENIVFYKMQRHKVVLDRLYSKDELELKEFNL